jgi:hypothetical protein
MFLTQAIGLIMAVLIVVGCLLLLWGMVSFSIIEPGRQRGWQQRLRQPNPAEVAARWNIRVPPSVELLFQNTIVKESKFYLRPPVGDSCKDKIWTNTIHVTA